MEKIWLKNYGKNVPHEVNLGNYQSLAEVAQESFKNFADHPAFHNMGTTITYRDLDEQSTAFANYLIHELRMQKGDRLALMMPNILQYPICLFGAIKAGIIVVNVNPLYTARELLHQLNDSGSKAIVIFENSASTLQEVLAKTNVKHVLVTAVGDLLKFPKSHIVNFVLKHVKKLVPNWSIDNFIPLKVALKIGKQLPKYIVPNLNHDDIAFLQYTGGTTGVSKGAILTHKNIIANFLQAKAWLEDTVEGGKDIIITPLPLYHIFSLTANCLVFSSIGALNILITNPRDITGFIKEIKKWKFTALTGVNTLFNALIHHPDFTSIDFRTLKITLGGGMAVQKAVADKWQQITKKPLIEAYGLTETSPAACINPMSTPAFNGFIGLPIPSTDIKIKNDEGKNLGIDEIGEICIKGPQVMQGYWKRNEETANVMTPDGYFRTGDIGIMNAEGYFKIVDRKKDMILTSGFNVYPNEIEDIVCQHPKVLEAAAIGVADERCGEVVKLFVVKKDESLTIEELKEYCKKNFTAYKVPKYYEFRKELPKSNVGKILRKDLRGT